MASESSVTDQSIDEHAEEKKVGDVSKRVDDEEIIFQPKEAAGNDEAANNKEDLTGMASTASVSEEKLELDGVSVADGTKKEEQHEKVGDVKNSLQESEVSNSFEPAVETNEGNNQSQADGAHETPNEVQEKSSDFFATSASQEPVVSESKTEDLEYIEIKPKSENERKPGEVPLVSTGVDISKDGNVEGETLETTNPEFSKDKVDIQLIKSEDSKDEIQVLVPSEIPTVVVPDASETLEKNVDSSSLTSIEVPVKDLEVEFGYPEEQKLTESTETKEPSSNVSTIDAGGEVGSSYEANPAGVAEVVEKKDDGLEVETIHTSAKIEEDLEAKPELAQTQSDENVFQGVEVKKNDEIVDGDIETSTVPDDVPPLAKVSSEEEKVSEPGVAVEEKEVETSSECENIDSVSKVAEVSLEGGNVLEGDELVYKDKFVNAEAVERELIDTFTDPTEAEVSSDQVKAPTTTEIVKEALEVTSKELNIAPKASEIPCESDKVYAGDEEKSENLKGGDAPSVEAPKDITTAEGSLDHVTGEKKSESSISETQAPSEDKLFANAEAVERDTFTDPNEAEVSSDQVKAPTTTEIVKEALEVTSKELSIAPEASEIPSEGDKVSVGDEEKSESLKGGDATSVEVPKEITTAEASLDQVIGEKKSESSISETEAEVSSDQIKAPTTAEIVKDALEVTSKELNIAPEDRETPSDGDKVSAGDEEKSESLKGGDAISVEAPKYITTAEASLDQVIEEKKSESSRRETQAPSEDKLVDKEKDVNEEAKEINLQSQADGAHETLSVLQSDFVETSASQEPLLSESKTENLKDIKIKPTSENERKTDEAPLVSTGVDISEGGNVETETQETANPESSMEKVDIELIKSEDSKDEIQVLVPAEIPTVVVLDASKTSEKNDVDSSNLTSIEVPVKDLEVESGSPEEHKPKESTETKEPSSNASKIDAGGEVVGSSYETKPSGVAEVVEKKDDSLKVETIKTSVEIHEDLEAKPELAQTQSDENVLEGVEVKKDDEVVEGGIETSTDLDDFSSLAKVSSEEEKASEPGVVVVEEEISLEGDNVDTVPKVAELSLEGDKLVDKEEVVNTKAVERDLVDTFIDPAEAEVSSDQVKAPASSDEIKTSATTEIVKEESDREALEVTSKELNIAPEANEVPSESDKLSAGDEKSENLKGEAATSVEEPKYITTAEESLDQVIEKKKSESSISEIQAPSADKLVDKGKDVNKEAKEISLQSQTDGAHEIPNVVQSDFVETSTSLEPVFSESKTEDLKDTEIKPTSENERKPVEAPLVSTGVDISENGNVEAETQEATNPEFPKDKVDIELIKSEDSKDDIQVLVPTEIPTVVVPDASKTLEKKDVDSSNLSSIEVPVKDLEVESGSPKEQKPKVSIEAKEPSSYEGTIDAGGEVVGSCYEVKPSGVAEVAEKKDDSLEVETIRTSVEIDENLEAKPELAQTQSDENVSEGVEVKKDDEIVKGGIETSTVPDDVPPVGKVSSEEENASEPVVVVEEDKTSLEVDNIDTVAEVSLEGGNVLEGDKLVKVVNSEAVERDLSDTFTDPAEAEVSSDQVKAPATTEIVKEESDKEALEVTSKELNIVPEASEVPSEGDTFSVGDEEKSESLIVGDATSVEAPKDIIAINESLDQLVEEKSESSASEMAAPTEDKLVDKEKNVNVEVEERDLINTSTDPTAAEVSSELVKAPEIVEVESYKQALEETSNELNIAPEASEVPSEGDKLSAGDEKRESLKGEAATSVEAPKDITTVEESLDQVIEEKKNESSIRETKAPSEDKLVDKAKDVYIEAKERDLFDTSTDPPAAEVYSHKVEAPKTVETVKYESDKQALEVTSKEPNIAAEAIEVPSEGDNISAGDEQKSESLKIEAATSVEASKYFTATEELLDQVIEEKKSESFISETGTPAEDRFVDNEKDTYVETIPRDLVDTSADSTAAEVSSEQVKASETAEIVKEEGDKQALEVTSKEFNITPEASEVSSEVDKVCAGDEEKSESLKGEDAILLEAPKDITTAEELLDQVIKEKKSEGSLIEMEAPAEDKLVEEEKDLVDTSTDPTAAEVSFDQVKASETAEIIKEESTKQALEVAYKELNIASKANEVPSEGDEVSAGDDEKSESFKGEDVTSVEVPKDITIAEELPDHVIKQKKNESSKSEMEALVEDKLVEKEKYVNLEAEKEVLVDTSTDPSADEVSSEQLEAPETAEIIKESDKEALELTSKELNIVPSEDDKVSAGEEEKIERLKGEDATSMVVPKDSTAAEESIDQLIEENKSESTKSDTEAPIEITRDFDTSKLFPEALKYNIASEAVEEKQDETSNDLSVEEKKAYYSEDKREEVKVEGALQNATDKPELEELGDKKAESEKSKDQDPIVSSDTGDAKLTKEVTKRESNIFSKVKRSIVKAKKAILRKSPGPKTRSSEAKDENT